LIRYAAPLEDTYILRLLPPQGIQMRNSAVASKY
jgi:hypothetical protein